jgi:hypothetical protein
LAKPVYIPVNELEGEIWGKIPNYPNYSVSTCGRIRNDNSGIFLRLNLTKKGYYHTTLYDSNSKSRTFKVHRIVASVHIPNTLNKPQINHIDGNKINNNISNLEWCTHSENQIHAYKNKLNVPKRGSENRHFGKYRGSSIRAKLILSTQTGIYYDCAKDAADSINMNYSTFKSMLNAKSSKSKNFIYV